MTFPGLMLLICLLGLLACAVLMATGGEWREVVRFVYLAVALVFGWMLGRAHQMEQR